ncbi:hypothetical protein ACHAXN_008130 [Cyclotella atomus]
MSGRYITLAARQLRDSRVNRFIDHRATKASTTPVPSKTPKGKATRSSEKETPTVVGTQGPGPLVLGHHDELDAATNAASVAGSRKSTMDASIATSTNSSNSSSEETEKDVQAQATMMLQTTLECGIASICRLRKLYPSSFFKKSDLEGTSVTQFDVEHLENLLDSDNTQEESMEGEFGGETLSPLTTTQKTHNTAQYTQRERRGRGREDTQRDVSDAKAATEALMLIRWIGKQGVNVLMKNDQLASVHFGIMLPKDEEGCDELLEQYVFQFGQNEPTQPSQNLAMTQARSDICSFFQNLNGYSAGSLSQAIVPMTTQGTVGTQASGASQFDFLATQQTGCSEDTKSVGPRYDSQKSGYSRSQARSVASMSNKSRRSRKSLQSVASMSQKSVVESMTQSIKASVKRNKSVRIPFERYLTLRIEFTKSLSSSELPKVLRSKSTTTSPKPQTKGMVITPLGTVSEESCTGRSVAMTAYSKADKLKYGVDVNVQKSDSQFMIDELVLENGAFKPFTQMDLENNNDDASKCSKADDLKSTTSRSSKASKRKVSHKPGSPNKKSRCVCPLEPRILPSGSKAFGIPSIGNNGAQTYLKCIILEHHLNSTGEEYKVEFGSKSLERKKQWVPVRKVVKLAEMRKRIESALGKLDCDDEEELIETVAEKLGVGAAYVGAVLSKLS